MKKAPAFQFYADDFIGGTQTMSHEERGFYILLLSLQWTKGGISPDDFIRLGRGIAQPSLTHVKSKFKLEKDGLLKNERMEEVRAEQTEFRINRSKSGKAGAYKRWHSHSTAIAQSMANTMAKHSSPSPTPIKYNECVESPFAIPEKLNKPEFVNLWNKWLEHLKQKRKTPTILAAEMQMKKLADMGIDRAIAALTFSITGNYQGLFEPNDRQDTKKPSDKMSEKEMLEAAMR